VSSMSPHATAAITESERAEYSAVNVVEAVAPVATVLPRYFTVRQASRYLGRTESAIYHLVARRDIPFIKHRRRLMFDRLALERWMQRGKVDAASLGSGGGRPSRARAEERGQ
jgi:excisionase family DNA binding protein